MKHYLTTTLRLRRRCSQSTSPRLLDAECVCSAVPIVPLICRFRRGLFTTSNPRAVPDVTESVSLDTPASRLRLQKPEGPHEYVLGRGDDNGEMLCSLWGALRLGPGTCSDFSSTTISEIGRRSFSPVWDDRDECCRRRINAFTSTHAGTTT